jgi:tetratricopeptide (TPR) repeat protein
MSDNFDDKKSQLRADIESRNQELIDLSQRGYQLLKENYIAQAEECFLKILEEDQYNNYALVGMGDAARKKKRFHDAIDYYQRCLKIHPQNNYALFGLADCYKSLKHYHKAIDVWEVYLNHDDRNVTVLTRVADAYRKVKNLEKSKELYTRVLEMEPENPYALIGLGHLHYDFNLYEEALLYWKKMYERQKKHVDIRVLTSLGNCHRKMKTFSEGIPYFEEALERDPKNFYALFGLADCFRGLNQQEQSLTYWNRILKQDPQNKVILTRAADAYRNMGEFDLAEEYYQKALNIEFDTYAILGLAMINKQKEKYQDAIDSLEGLLKNDPKNHRLYAEIADCYLLQGDKKSAMDTLSQYQKIGPRNPYIMELLDKTKRAK